MDSQQIKFRSYEDRAIVRGTLPFDGTERLKRAMYFRIRQLHERQNMPGIRELLLRLITVTSYNTYLQEVLQRDFPQYLLLFNQILLLS